MGNKVENTTYQFDMVQLNSKDTVVVSALDLVLDPYLAIGESFTEIEIKSEDLPSETQANPLNYKIKVDPNKKRANPLLNSSLSKKQGITAPEYRDVENYHSIDRAMLEPEGALLGTEDIDDIYNDIFNASAEDTFKRVFSGTRNQNVQNPEARDPLDVTSLKSNNEKEVDAQETQELAMSSEEAVKDVDAGLLKNAEVLEMDNDLTPDVLEPTLFKKFYNNFQQGKKSLINAVDVENKREAIHKISDSCKGMLIILKNNVKKGVAISAKATGKAAIKGAKATGKAAVKGAKATGKAAIKGAKAASAASDIAVVAFKVQGQVIKQLLGAIAEAAIYLAKTSVKLALDAPETIMQGVDKWLDVKVNPRVSETVLRKEIEDQNIKLNEELRKAKRKYLTTDMLTNHGDLFDKEPDFTKIKEEFDKLPIETKTEYATKARDLAIEELDQKYSDTKTYDITRDFKSLTLKHLNNHCEVTFGESFDSLGPKTQKEAISFYGEAAKDLAVKELTWSKAKSEAYFAKQGLEAISRVYLGLASGVANVAIKGVKEIKKASGRAASSMYTRSQKVKGTAKSNWAKKVAKTDYTKKHTR